jgi:hypothetical protein
MPSLMIGSFNAGSFIVNLGTSYLLGRLTAQDGPRLDNLQAAGGDYGVGMPRAYGTAVRLTGIFIAQDDILETEHTVEDYSEIVGVLTGAAQGFMIGGPVGAIVGGIAGGLFGAATPDQKYYTYSDTFAVMLADRTDDDPVEGITKVWANGKLIFNSAEATMLSETFGSDGKLMRRRYRKNKYFRSLTLFAGHDEQPVSATLESVVGEDSAYPFTAYVVISTLQLAQWGNSVPSIEVLTTVKTDQSLAEVAEAMCAAAGIDHELDLSTTALTSDTIRGYQITSVGTTCWDAAKPLMPVFGVDCAEVAGQLRFYKRSQSMRATIPQDDMGSHVYGDSPPERFMFKRATDLDLPKETSLTFIDPDRDYQENTATSRRSEGSARSNVSTSLPLVLTADEGATTAALMHWDAWLGRTRLDFTLADNWVGLETGLAYAIPIADQYVPYRITRKTRGANGIIEVEALSDESVTYTASEIGSSGTVPDDESTLFADTRLILMDMPILEDPHDDFGFYIVMGGSEDDWPRGRIQASSDGTNFVTIIDQPSSAIMGDVTGTLAAGTTTGLDDTLDTTSVLTVVLLHDGMTLESATDTELDNWANFAFVGKDGLGEYLQFKTATFVSGTTWQLTNLRRGRKGTDHAIGTHASGEEFALLGGAGVFRINYTDETQWGTPLTFRGVTLHQDEADADTEAFTNTGEGKRPYSPVNVEGAWDGSNNLTITWDARSRLNAGGLGEDDQNNYEVEIISGAGRVITATGVETASYSAANQTTDGITPGDSITGRVRQLSDVNDGRWRDFTLIGPNDAIMLEDDITFLELEDDTTPLELES